MNLSQLVLSISYIKTIPDQPQKAFFVLFSAMLQDLIPFGVEQVLSLFARDLPSKRPARQENEEEKSFLFQGGSGFVFCESHVSWAFCWARACPITGNNG